MMMKSCLFVLSDRSVTPHERAFKAGLHNIEILMHYFLAHVIKSITMKQVAFGSFWSTATA